MDDDRVVRGPPEELLAVRDELTPMLAQYVDLCAEYDDCLLLFQVGDFYEAFGEAAAEVARVCEVTLTKREDSTGQYRMAGIPIDNAAGYVESLLAAGYRVAVADQVEDAAQASGLVDRAVTQVVTPGTVVEDELLDSSAATYVAALVRGGEPDAVDLPDDEATFALAALDVSTGECLVTSVDSRERVLGELERVDPAELLAAPGVDVDERAVACAPARSPVDPETFDRDAARATLERYVSRPEAVVANDAELRAVGGVLAYAEYTQGGEPLAYVSRITRYDPRDSLELDAAAIRSLELFESRSHAAGATLLDTLDETASALGRRRLAEWLRRPLVDRARIAARHDAVGELADGPLARESIRERLAEVYDVERLVGRVSRGRANARDLRSLATTLGVVPDLRDALADADCDALSDLRDALDPCGDVRDLIERAVAADPPQEITEGGVIREGFDDELDALRSTEREGREWVADLEARERERTGIDSLDVGYNQVHGYYIEVTNPNLDRVPDDYQRRQTLKNAERFYTPALKRREDEILSAADRADALEYELFVEVRGRVAAETERLQRLADALARLDALAALAAAAVARGYVRPEVTDDPDAGIRIEGGRHPVVERTQEGFVPNDAELARGEIAIITGPNMSGKSTFMRQVALCVVLAQAGSFVPADAARLPVVDRVFTRVGASDDIAGGQSTFMREMAELTDILHNATDRSLVLLDEVGRGTATVDGLAIARATTEFVHDEIGATTLFATHYHDLTALAREYERVTNLHFTAARDGERVTFLHQVADGPSSASYGVEVARMAGVPDRVVDRARQLVADGAPSPAGGTADTVGDVDATSAAGRVDPARTNGSDGGEPALTNGSDGGEPARVAQPPLDAYAAGGPDPSDALDPATDGRTHPAAGRTHPADGLDAARAESLSAVVDELARIDVADTTPLEALTLLDDLQSRLDGS